MSYKLVFCPSVSSEVVNLVESLNNMLSVVPSNHAQHTDFFPKKIDDKLSTSLVVLYDSDKAIAWMSVKRLTDNVCEVRRMYSANTVDEATILAALEHKAQEQGYTFIRLLANRLSDETRNYYMKQGYRLARSHKITINEVWLIKNLASGITCDN